MFWKFGEARDIIYSFSKCGCLTVQVAGSYGRGLWRRNFVAFLCGGIEY